MPPQLSAASPGQAALQSASAARPKASYALALSPLLRQKHSREYILQAEVLVARALGRALGDGERLRHERDGAVADGAGAGVDEAAEVRRAAALAAGAVAVDCAELAVGAGVAVLAALLAAAVQVDLKVVLLGVRARVVRRQRAAEATRGVALAGGAVRAHLAPLADRAAARARRAAAGAVRVERAGEANGAIRPMIAALGAVVGAAAVDVRLAAGAVAVFPAIRGVGPGVAGTTALLAAAVQVRLEVVLGAVRARVVGRQGLALLGTHATLAGGAVLGALARRADRAARGAAEAAAVHAGLVAVDDPVEAARADAVRALVARAVRRHGAPLSVRPLGAEHAAAVDAAGLVAVLDVVRARGADGAGALLAAAVRASVVLLAPDAS